MPVEPLLSRLEHVRSRGAGKWSARCPAHDDKDPSLSIAEMPDGRVLIKCFAGCGANDVITAAGLNWDVLFPPSSNYRPVFSRPKDALHEKAVLDICEATRVSGKRLTPAEKDREVAAWNRLYGGAA